MVLAVLLWLLCIACVVAMLVHAFRPPPRTAPPPIDPREERRRINAEARQDWERRWRQETGEVWGTMYITDRQQYDRLVWDNQRRMECQVSAAMVGMTLSDSLKPYPDIVFGEDPFKPKRTGQDGNERDGIA